MVEALHTRTKSDLNSWPTPSSLGILPIEQEITDISRKPVDPNLHSANPHTTGRSLLREIDQLPKVQELKSMPILTTGINFAKKNTARLLKLAGFMGAISSLVTYFLFNLKSLAILLGIPTGMAFYISHDLSQSIDKTAAEFSTNPHEILRTTINKPGNLETNFVTVLQAVEQIKDMSDSDHNKQSGIELIEDLNLIVDSKLRQLEGFEDQNSVALKHELERFKIAYDEMKADQLMHESRG